MTTLETILSRAMNDPAFAEALIASPIEVLAEHNLSAEEAEQFIGMSRADFEALTSASPEARKSMSLSLNYTKIQFNYISMDAAN